MYGPLSIRPYDMEPQNIVWGYSHTVPIDEHNIPKHDVKGVEHLRLLDPEVIEEPKEDDIEIYDIKLETNVSYI